MKELHRISNNFLFRNLFNGVRTTADAISSVYFNLITRETTSSTSNDFIDPNVTSTGSMEKTVTCDDLNN